MYGVTGKQQVNLHTANRFRGEAWLQSGQPIDAQLIPARSNRSGVLVCAVLWTKTHNNNTHLGV